VKICRKLWCGGEQVPIHVETICVFQACFRPSVSHMVCETDYFWFGHFRSCEFVGDIEGFVQYHTRPLNICQWVIQILVLTLQGIQSRLDFSILNAKFETHNWFDNWNVWSTMVTRVFRVSAYIQKGWTLTYAFKRRALFAECDFEMVRNHWTNYEMWKLVVYPCGAADGIHTVR
jgi:hypothetical protein